MELLNIQFVILPSLERLDDALFLDGIGQFLESDRGEFFARLERTGANPIQWNALHSLAFVNERCGWNRRRRVEGVRGGRGHGFSGGRSAQQRAQPTTQSWFCHEERVKKGDGDVNVTRLRE